MITALALAIAAGGCPPDNYPCNDADVKVRHDAVCVYTSMSHGSLGEQTILDGVNDAIAEANANLSPTQVYLQNIEGFHYLEDCEAPGFGGNGTWGIYGAAEWLSDECDGILDNVSDMRNAYGGDHLYVIVYVPNCGQQGQSFSPDECEADPPGFTGSHDGLIMINSWHSNWSDTLASHIETIVNADPELLSERMPATICPEDHNMSGAVTRTDVKAAQIHGNANDVADTLKQQGPCNPSPVGGCLYDANGDGAVNGTDLFILLAKHDDLGDTARLLDFLAAWGPCP